MFRRTLVSIGGRSPWRRGWFGRSLCPVTAGEWSPLLATGSTTAIPLFLTGGASTHRPGIGVPYASLTTANGSLQQTTARTPGPASSINPTTAAKPGAGPARLPQTGLRSPVPPMGNGLSGPRLRVCSSLPAKWIPWFQPFPCQPPTTPRASTSTGRGLRTEPIAYSPPLTWVAGPGRALAPRWRTLRAASRSATGRMPPNAFGRRWKRRECRR